MNDKIVTPNKQIIHSGILNNKPAVHLFEYRGWLKNGEIQRPLQDGSNVVSGRVCAGSWNEALPLVLERMRFICDQNKLTTDSYDLSFLAVKELDIPL